MSIFSICSQQCYFLFLSFYLFDFHFKSPSSWGCFFPEYKMTKKFTTDPEVKGLFLRQRRLTIQQVYKHLNDALPSEHSGALIV